MKKGNLILFALIGAGLIFAFKDKLFAQRSDKQLEDELGTGEDLTDTGPVTTKTLTADPGGLSDAIETGKKIVEGAKNVIVNIRNPEGRNIRIAKRSTRRAEKKQKIKARKEARIAKRKSKKKNTAPAELSN